MPSDWAQQVYQERDLKRQEQRKRHIHVPMSWKFGVSFKPQDFWIGAYWTRTSCYGCGGSGDEPNSEEMYAASWMDCGVCGGTGEGYPKTDVWICIIPCFPIHVIRRPKVANRN